MQAQITLEILRAHDPKGGGSGTEQRYRCPLCGGSEASLCVNELKAVWNCKRASCGAHGRLGGVADFDLREMARRQAEAERERRAKVARMMRDTALSGIAGTLGAEYLQSRGISLDTAQRARVVWCPRYLGYPAVVFRIRDLSGRVMALQGRYLHTDEQGQKCRDIGRKSDGTFSTAGAWDSELWLCEGPLDALSLAEMGIPAIAVLGSALPAWLLSATRGKIVHVATDADTAGDQAAREWALALRPYAACVRRKRPVRGKDWNEQLRGA